MYNKLEINIGGQTLVAGQLIGKYYIKIYS